MEDERILILIGVAKAFSGKAEELLGEIRQMLDKMVAER